MRSLLYFTLLICIIGYASGQRPVVTLVKITLGDTDNALDASQHNITLATYKALPIQQWLLLMHNDGSMTIQNYKTGSVIDLIYGTCTVNNYFTLYGFVGSNNQKLYLNGDKTISPYCDPEFKLGFSTGSTPQLILIPRSSSAASTFKISEIPV